MARNSNAGVAVYVDTKAYNAQAKKFRATYPEAYKAAQVALRGLAKQTLTQASSNASYSSRIPASGKVTVRGLNAKVIFGGDAASDASPIENKGKGLVRHPVFGNFDVWTAKNSHPAFLAPAFDESKEEALEILDNMIFAAMERTAGM